jgi:hypothetical protein
MTDSNATPIYRAYSSDGWTYETPSFVEAAEQLRYRLAKYGYPKVQDWLVDLVATNGDLSAGPWFYGHCGIETAAAKPHLVCAGTTNVCDTCGREMYPAAKVYGVTVNVERKPDSAGWHGSYGLPYFQVQACSESNAVALALDIIGAERSPGLTFHVCAVAL